MAPVSRLLTSLLVMLVVLTSFAAVPFAPEQVSANARDSYTPVPPAQTSTDEETFPLPKGCGGVTPPGDPEAACCLSGFVYIDGQIVAGAEVRVQSPHGDQMTLVTQIYSGTE